MGYSSSGLRYSPGFNKALPLLPNGSRHARDKEQAQTVVAAIPQPELSAGVRCYRRALRSCGVTRRYGAQGQAPPLAPVALLLPSSTPWLARAVCPAAGTAAPGP